MPLTFIDIERQKSWRIWGLFLLLMALYFVVIAVLTLPFLHFALNTPKFWLVAGIIALIVAASHFVISAYDTAAAVTKSLGADSPDPQDEVHKMFLDVMQEIHVVTGGKRVMRCVVIPSLSMNAMAAADLKGEAVIGITEGLLSRLTRPQLEAVVAHEAHHILSGDCLETTVAASLFGTIITSVEKLNDGPRNRAFASPAFLLAWILMKLTYLLNMFISRERELRADAASVRMTRDPISLAETLHLLSRSWRGAGFIGSGLEMLCIVNPEASALDETEGFWADLMSTHPPLKKRIDILLRMAHVSLSELEALADAEASKNAAPAQDGPAYYAMNPRQQWQGPFSLAELGSLPWLSPLTWITQRKDKAADRAWKDPAVNAIFVVRLAGADQPASGLSCPACRQPLIIESYEGTQMFECRYCGGVLVENAKIPRIIARTNRGRPCSERINSLAKAVVRENQMRQALQNREGAVRKTMLLLSCPKCKNAMYRGFYSLAHPIEIDRCSFCGLTWFDQDELQMLQCLIENRIVPDISETHAHPVS